MVPRIASLALGAALGLSAGAAMAQEHQWSVGATYGAIDDVERSLALDGFHPRDVTAWVDFRMEPRVLLRASYVNLRTSGDNAGRTLSVSGQPPAPLPELTVNIQAVTLGVSYTVVEGFYTGGLFAGIGGYRIRPQDAAPELAPYLDRRQTAFGFHGGVDGDFRVVKAASVVLRLTFYGILSETNRSLLVASAGLALHF